jgi:hypothetical protein
MKALVLPYAERQHSFFGSITRPVVSLNFYSERFGQWFVLKNVLVDTGADITVIPFPLGEALVTDVQHGQLIRTFHSEDKQSILNPSKKAATSTEVPSRMFINPSCRSARALDAHVHFW